jgi:formylglycine-generating enzyme required for sulfatase activity
VTALLPAHPALAARCIGEGGGQRPPAAVMRAVQERLTTLATGLEVPVRKRNAAGDALNHLGDPRPGVGLTHDGLPDIAWCEVPAGEFIMGSQDDKLALGKETPQHAVEPSVYSISKYPITNAQFDAFVQDDGYTDTWRACWTAAGWEWKGDRNGPNKYGGVFDLPNHPAVMVTWYEAHAFCAWLGKKLDKVVSLPSEAQWEKAARSADGRTYPWGEKITPDHANYDDTGIGSTTAVGIFPKGASSCSALDMSGNVWEWTRTLWGEDYHKSSYNYPYSTADGRENLDAPSEVARVLRGGAFDLDARLVRCAFRGGIVPNGRDGYSGFRVVASPIIHDSGG